MPSVGELTLVWHELQKDFTMAFLEGRRLSSGVHSANVRDERSDSRWLDIFRNCGLAIRHWLMMIAGLKKCQVRLNGRSRSFLLFSRRHVGLPPGRQSEIESCMCQLRESMSSRPWILTRKRLKNYFQNTVYLLVSCCNDANINIICRHFSGWTSSKLYLQSCCFFPVEQGKR